MNIYINCMTGEQKIAMTSPGEMWSCLGAAQGDFNTGSNQQYTDVNMIVADDFTDEDL